MFNSQVQFQRLVDSISRCVEAVLATGGGLYKGFFLFFFICHLSELFHLVFLK